MQLKLIVLRTHNIKDLADFYSLLGVEFDYHKHEKGSFHYSSKIGDLVFEIYPLHEKKIVDKTLRLGFKVENLISKLKVSESLSYKIISFPIETEYGFVAVIEDLDGRKIELTEL